MIRIAFPGMAVHNVVQNVAEETQQSAVWGAPGAQRTYKIRSGYSTSAVSGAHV